MRLHVAPLLLLLQACVASRTAGEEAYFEALRLQKEGGDRARVVQLLDRAVELEPANVEFRRGRGLYRFDAGEYQTALIDFHMAGEFPGSGQAYCLYLKGLTEGRLGKYQDALTDLERAERLQPENAQFYVGSSLAQLALKRPDLALRDIVRAKSYGHPAAHWSYVHGVVLACLGRKEESVAEFNRTPVYTEAGPDGRTRDHYFDGEQEFARVQACSPEQLHTLWHYGGGVFVPAR